jgi:hypothetical protein
VGGFVESKILRFIPSAVVALGNTALTVGGYENALVANLLWALTVVLLLVAALPYLKRIQITLVKKKNGPSGFPVPGKPTRPAATPEEMQEHEIVNRSVWIKDVLDGDVLRERRFVRCTIIGPALFVNVTPGNEIGRCAWVDLRPDYRNVLVPVEDGTVLNGAVKMDRVAFIDCDMVWCSLMGTPVMVDEWKASGFGDRPSKLSTEPVHETQDTEEPSD